MPVYPHPNSKKMKPIPKRMSQGKRASLLNGPPVQLLVTNLDGNIEQAELRKMLKNLFKEKEVPVLQISVIQQSSNSSTSTPSHKAIVKVMSQKDAQVAVSKLHRAKLGNKRLLISYMNSERYPTIQILKAEVLSILEEIPSKKLPLVTFQEIFEKRYNRSISMSDIYKLKDILLLIQQPVEENYAGLRFVCLNLTPNPNTMSFESDSVVPYCKRHIKVSEKEVNYGWAERETMLILPPVKITLKSLAPKIHKLLDTHSGNLPLNSILDCYSAEFEEHFNMQESPAVSLEHLISCIPGVQITLSPAGFKRVQWSEKKQETASAVEVRQPTEISTASDAITKQLIQFSREVRDLLKSQPHCLIPFSKFVPAYHNHFGRQCCVYQYGFTRLIDLLQAIPHIVQVLGEGAKRSLTLTHKEQTKRFASDLVRVLKAQRGKKVFQRDLPEKFEKILMKPFNITDYGVCNVSDILADVWEGTVLITISNNEQKDIIIEIPKKEQTKEEMKRTKIFAKEVIELLRSTPTLTLSFSKFIPSYHHYFNRQCKVSDYGFSKLIELFEIISPEVIEIIDRTDEEKVISLSRDGKLAAIGCRLSALLKANEKYVIELVRLEELYKSEFGHSINYDDYEASDMVDLISKIPFQANFKKINEKSCEVPRPPYEWLEDFKTSTSNLLRSKPRKSRIAANFDVAVY